MDKVVQKLVALGVPGLVVLVIVATSGLTGAAAIVSALALLGGPFGMLGGIAMIALLALVADAVAEYGLESLFMAVVDGLRRKGISKSQIKREINSYPISDDLKRKIRQRL